MLVPKVARRWIVEEFIHDPIKEIVRASLKGTIITVSSVITLQLGNGLLSLAGRVGSAISSLF